MLFNKNDKIGPYIVKFPHKQGSYAETYRVKDTSGKTCFLKLIDYAKLNRHRIDDNGNVVEVEMMKQLNHHNLCRYIDSGVITKNGGQQQYVVTEFISGETLAERMIRQRMSVYDIKVIAKAVLSALSYLHEQPMPIIHGEVTAQNILLDLVHDFKDLKLIDFGHARFLNQKPFKPDLDDYNLFYLAPERFSGVSQVQSDLYSVGAMMYHLLYGMLPWFIDVSRVSPAERVDAVLAERHKKTLHFDEVFELDEQLKNTILRALNYQVEGRFQTASEFIRAIDGELKIDKPEKRVITVGGEKTGDGPTSNIPHIAKGKGFAAIAGMERLKEQMRKEVIKPLQEPEKYKAYGITIPNGMLLWGPPGCGKTFFVKHLAEELGFNYMYKTPADLMSRYVNATQENIKKMFKEAEENAPTIIFIDEINALVPDRDDVHEMTKNAVNEMLAQMDRTGERNIFVVGATNFPDTLDPAILRAGRLEKIFYVGPPDYEARKGLFKLELKEKRTSVCDFGLDYDELAQITERYVSADLSKIVNDAARKAAELSSKITMKILRETITANPPSITSDILKQYDQLKNQMEGKKPVEKERKRIGFH